MLLEKLAAPDLAPADRLEVSQRFAAVDGELAAKLKQWEIWLDEISSA